MKAIAVLNNDNRWYLVAKVNNKSVKLVPRGHAGFMRVPENEVQAVVDKLRNGAVGWLTDISIVDAETYEQAGNRNNPVVRVNEDTPTAKLFGIKPWHHVHFRGDKALLVVWDTRHVDDVIDINLFANSDFQNMQMVYDDNHKGFRVAKQSELSAKVKQVAKESAIISDEQFNLIQK